MSIVKQMQPFWGRSSLSILLPQEIFQGGRPMRRVNDMVVMMIFVLVPCNTLKKYQQTSAWGYQLGWRHFQQTANSGWMGIHIWLWSLFARTSRRLGWIWSCRKNIAKAGCKFKLTKLQFWLRIFSDSCAWQWDMHIKVWRLHTKVDSTLCR